MSVHVERRARTKVALTMRAGDKKDYQAILSWEGRKANAYLLRADMLERKRRSTRRAKEHAQRFRSHQQPNGDVHA